MLLIKYQTTDFPLLILHHLFISSAYKALFHTRVTDSNRVPSIYVDIPTPPCIYDIIPSCADIRHVGKINLVPLMAKPSLQLEVVISYGMKYPRGSSFCLEEFNGVDDQHRLVSHPIKCAKKMDGTQLLPGRYNKTQLKKE